jgi:hypothetical protein
MYIYKGNIYDNVISISEIKVCRSSAGFYVGCLARVTYTEKEVPWTRHSDYFENEKEALYHLNLTQKRIQENSFDSLIA